MILKSRSRITFNKTILVLVLAAVFTVAYFLFSGNVILAQSPDDCEAVFNANCVACHSTGTNKLVGPGLAGQTDADYIRESIVDPGAVVVEGFTDIMPPDFGTKLSLDDIDDLVAYIGTLSLGAGSADPALISAVAGDGDAGRGENLFTGPTRFENRGPSCVACHSSSGIGALGGGSLGPDLTGSYAKLGDAMMIWPETVAPMSPIFTDRPLTDQEKADLLAFFKSADVTEREAEQILALFGISVGGLVVIAIFTHLIWRRRLRGVRRPMVGEPSLTSGRTGSVWKRLLTGLLWEQSAPSSRR